MQSSPTFDFLVSISNDGLYSGVDVLTSALPYSDYKETMVSTELVCHFPSRILDNVTAHNKVCIKCRFAFANLVE